MFNPFINNIKSASMSPQILYLDMEKRPSKFIFVEDFQINTMKCS